MWIVCFWLSLGVLALSVLLACRAARQKQRKLRPLYLLFGGVFLSAVFLLYPIWRTALQQDANGTLKAILVSMHDTIQFFTADSDYGLVRDGIDGLGEPLREAYAILGAVLALLAPLLTFGFVLTFFKGISSRLRMAFHLPADMYVFSEINPRAVALAEGVRAQDARALVVFTNAPKDGDGLDDDLLSRVNKLHAIVYWDDISLIRLRRAVGGYKTCLFTICDREAESITETLQLVEKYKERENTFIYLFSHNVDSELMLNNIDKGKLKVRRVNPTVSLINHILTEEGAALFDNAVPMNEDTKMISALVVGVGGVGTAVLKALAWYCQMDGYVVNINGIDSNEDTLDRLKAQCPELMDRRYNGQYRPGEAFYRIRIHQAVMGSATFRQKVREIGTVTYVFVALGDDSLNVSTAVELRVLFEQMHIHPRIVAVMTDSERRTALENACDRNGTPYDIHYVGDMATVYSPDVIINSAWEQKALELHKRYNNGDPYGFYEFEYNYKSSMASVIHNEARRHCGILGSDKKEADMTPEERDSIETLEHKRWNAYMRSEGFIYSGSKDKQSRNDLGRMHHNLVEFDELEDEDKRKDSRVGAAD